jgi:hypothetical protein
VSAQQSTSVRPVAERALLAVPIRLARSLEENGTLVMVVAAFGVVMLIALRNALTIDGYMALVAGREIAQHGLPSHDSLAVWTHGDRWVDQQWLAQLVLYGLSRAGGVKLALLVHAALATGALAGAAVLARRLGGSARTTTWVCLPVLAAYYPEAAVLRPQTFAYPLFVAVLWLLARDARRHSNRVFLTLPLLVVWANLHGSALLGAALVAVGGLVRLAEAFRSADRVAGARGVLLAVAGWPCLLVSPYAADLPAYYQKVLHGGNFSHFVTEWAPTTLTPATASVYLLIFAGLWLLGRSGERISTFEKLAFLVTVVLALQAVRNTAWLGLTALVVLPTLADSLRRPVLEPARVNRRAATVVLAGVVVALAGVAVKPQSWFAADFPSRAGDAATAAAGQRGRVFATSRYADWLLWAEPQLRGRVAFDARYELLTAEQVATLGAIQARSGDWRRALDGYRVIVLDRRDDRALQTALLNTHSVRVARIEGSVVVLRRR